MNHPQNQSQNILAFLTFASKLKKQQRTIKIFDDRHESVADHSWQLALMVLLVAPHLKIPVDLFRTLKMALVHDLVEAEIGDTPYGHTANNNEAIKTKKAKESAEIRKIKKLIGGELGQEVFDLWHEFETGKTSEAKLARALDSLEANFQSSLFDVSYWDDYFYPIALAKAEPLCTHETILQELNIEINNRLLEEYKKAGVIIERGEK